MIPAAKDQKYLLPLRSPQENRKEGVTVDRLRMYESGELTLDEMVVFAQDVTEAQALIHLPARHFLMHQHLKRVGLIHTIDRPSH